MKSTFFNSIKTSASEKLKQYADVLISYNKKINLVSRKMGMEELYQLMDESILLIKYISKKNDEVVDAGSGNGLLGVPVAIIEPGKKVVLVEPRKKKSQFLQFAKNELGLDNVQVCNESIEEFLKREKKKKRTLIARGFPRLGVFSDYLKKELFNEAILITSDNKIKKNQIHLEKVRKKIYNVPLRDNLKILKMENTERE